MTLKLSNRDWPMGASNASPRRPRVGSVSWAGLLSCYFWTSAAGSKRNCTPASLAPDSEPHITHCADADVALVTHH
jgi:hypothetical protein